MFAARVLCCLLALAVVGCGPASGGPDGGGGGGSAGGLGGGLGGGSDGGGTGGGGVGGGTAGGVGGGTAGGVGGGTAGGVGGGTAGGVGGGTAGGVGGGTAGGVGGGTAGGVGGGTAGGVGGGTAGGVGGGTAGGSAGGTGGGVGTALATPTNVAVAYRSGTSVRVSWVNAATAATGTRVERAPASTGPYQTVGTAAAAATFLDDATVSLSTPYWFRVTAVSGGTAGVASAPVTATPPSVPAAPAAPTGLVASQLTSVSLRLDWAHPGTNLKGFRVERLMNYTGYAYVEVADLPASARSFSDTCLRPGTPLLYRVSAYNEVGSASATLANNATTLAPTTAPTLAPSNLKATQVTVNSYRIEWTNACTTADRILVEVATGPGFTNWASVLGSTQPYFMSDATWFLYTNLPAGSSYRFRVSAGNALGFTATTAPLTVNGPASFPAGTGALGIYADYDNTKTYTDLVPTINNTVYASGSLTVGCFWSYNTFVGMQDFMCYSAALHFPMSGTSTGGTAFNLAGKTIDRALLVLSTSAIPVNATTYSASAISQAWSTSTLTGGTSLTLYSAGASAQPSPTVFGAYAFDVTTMVRNWASGTFVNNGVLLEDADYVFPNNSLIRTSFFWSTDANNNDQKNRPTLWVDYH